MARYRTIKPEFWTSAQVLECSRNARLMFIGLWNFADDYGVHPANAKQIKAELFPADDLQTDSIIEMLRELEDNDLIQIYAVDGKEYLLITGWHHQRIDKPQKAKYPSIEQADSKNIPRTVQEHSVLNRKERKGIEGKGIERKGKESSLSKEANQYSDEITQVFEYWKTVMNHEKSILDQKRKKLILTALKLGYTVDECKQAINGCSVTPHNIGINDRNTRYDGIHIIFKDADQIDRFIRASLNPPKIKNQQQNLEDRNAGVIGEWVNGG